MVAQQAAATETAAPSLRPAAVSAIDLALQATSAYNRPDLGERLQATRRRLSDPAFHVLVIGEFKQGKSTLINALLNAPVCPVDDDIATSAPTAVRYAEQPSAWVNYSPPEDADVDQVPVREEIPVNRVHEFVTEAANPENRRRVQSVEIGVSRKLLNSGLVLVDTPGVGGLGSAHSTTTIGALPMADAVIFVSDSSQEYSGPELDFLHTARKMCPNILCVLTKIDFYPEWRTIRSLNEGHLAKAGVKATLLPVSSALRLVAIQGNDKKLNEESGFPSLIKYLQDEIVAKAESLVVRGAASDMLSVTAQLEVQFTSERQALANPEQAERLVATLTSAKEQAERLRSQAAKWQQTLNDGFSDLIADIDHDLRARMRLISRQADEAIDASDPGESWEEFEPWLYRRVAEDVTNNYTYLQARAAEVADRVGDHFNVDGNEIAGQLAITNPTDVMAQVAVDANVEMSKEGVMGSSMTALRGSYGGLLMFGMLGRMVGLAMLNPAVIVVGLLMGRKAMKDEKARALAMRRSQAKNAHRKYTDEVSFAVGKDSRDTLRRIQRQLRDYFAARAEEILRSASESLTAAQQAVKSDESTRQSRLRDVEAELTRIKQLRERVTRLSPELAAAK